ncbi:ABC transporter substrate-binding protein, partial [Salmonella enterica subsp. enterica serovar Montevideo]|nr:ABC transporter substrate-binding protein [Salmonella enterica subsp. enterica serovar Montevideo]
KNQYPAVKSSTERGSDAPYSSPSGPTIILWVLPIASFSATFCNNVQKKPLDNVKVRQALTYAVNKEAIIKAVYQGAGVAAKNLIP